MKYTVFYESWQMECCGKSFVIGDTVKWLVCVHELNNIPIDIGHIDYCYEAHSSEVEKIFVLEGNVQTIKLLYTLYVPEKEGSPSMIPVDGVLIDTNSVTGTEKDYNGMICNAYVVSMDNCTIRPAAADDVTFK